ncbi:acyl-CoA dehydrogenase family protein [Nakamurella deserti]|uniref:acyl-CoA dehydrogenase family protein n=1 Tax=Nakamurella deserti TaxID=2164074 RepID=UPI000DBEAAC0|nr:acyl-CoA dehydrogenase family protein [Nakamurella deserti]
MTDFTETAEHAELRAVVHQIAARYGGADYADHGRRGDPQEALWKELADNGFIGINVPTEYGGGGAGMTELAIVAEEAAAAGSPLLLLLVSGAIAVEVLKRHGSAEQRRTWLTRLADGHTVVAFAITEPDAGSNSHRVATVARRDGDDWVINGSKYYISGIDGAAAVITVARTGVDEQTGKARLAMFLVPTDAAGLSWQRIDMAAQIPDRQFTVFYDDVRVPATAMIGTPESGTRPLFDGLNPERIAAAALCVGLGRYALERAADYARTRTVWDGAPIGAHQGVSHPLARARIGLDLAQLMMTKAAWLHDDGRPAAIESNEAKYAAAEAAAAAVDAAIQTHGGNGLTVEYGLMPLYGMARLLRIAPVNAEMLLNYVAQHSLKLPRSY